MTGKLLRSTKEKRRSPACAALVSLMVTGFGQVYTGRLLQGVALITLRALSLLIIPLALELKPRGDMVALFFTVIAVNAVIYLYSPLAALASSLRHRVMPLRSFNSLPVYILFSLASLLFTIFPAMAAMNFLDIREVAEPSSLLFRKGDVVLITTYRKGGFRGGDLVEYSYAGEPVMGRIIGTGGDTVRQDKYTFSVNGVQLGIGSFDEQDMERLSLGDYSRVLSEIQGGARYPIRAVVDRDIYGKTAPERKLPDGQILVAGDNREAPGFFRVIGSRAVTGRVEGIIYSGDVKRIFARPQLPAQ